MFSIRKTDVLAAVACVIIAGLVVTFRHPAMPLHSAVLAVAITGLGLLPGYLYLRTPQVERRPYPLLQLAGLYYAVFYGASAFLLNILLENAEKVLGSHHLVYIYSADAPRQFLPETQIAALAGLVLFMGAYGAVVRMVPAGFPSYRVLGGETDTTPPADQLLWAGIVVGCLAYLYIPAIKSLPSIGQFIVPAGTLAFGAYYLHWRSKRLSLLQTGFFVVTLAMLVAKLLLTGFLTPVLLLFVFFVLIEAWAKSLPWKSLLIAGLIFITVYPFLSKAREVLWQAKADRPVVERVITAAKELSFNFRLHFGEPDSVRDLNEYDPDFQKDEFDTHHQQWIAFNNLRGLVNRFSHILLLDRVVRLTPDDVPYWGGQTYRPMVSSFIPRAIWPGKPREEAGNIFGRRYGFITSDAPDMSINIPWLVELFANFGWKGVILGMTLIGGVLGLMIRFFSSTGATSTNAVAGMAVLHPLFYQESNLTLMFGSVLPFALCIWVYFRAGGWALERWRTRR